MPPAQQIKFELTRIAEVLQEKVKEIDFAFIFGSAQDGILRNNSDIDIAVYLDEKIHPSSALLLEIISVIENEIPCAECDITILNSATPITRFEALKGKLLFCRKNKFDEYLDFFSLTCREYESQMADFERQLSYQKEIIA